MSKVVVTKQFRHSGKSPSKVFVRNVNTEINVPGGTEQKHKTKVAKTTQQKFNNKLKSAVLLVEKKGGHTDWNIGKHEKNML